MSLFRELSSRLMLNLEFFDELKGKKTTIFAIGVFGVENQGPEPTHKL